MTLVNPLNASVALICTANQLTGFYMRATLAFNELSSKFLYLDLHNLLKSFWGLIFYPKFLNNVILSIDTIEAAFMKWIFRELAKLLF